MANDWRMSPHGDHDGAFALLADMRDRLAARGEPPMTDAELEETLWVLGCEMGTL